MTWLIQLQRPQGTALKESRHASVQEAYRSLQRLLRRCGPNGSVLVMWRTTEVAPHVLRDIALASRMPEPSNPTQPRDAIA